MLYTLYEWNRAAMLPVRMMAGAANIAFQNPFAPVSYTQFGRSVVAASELLERVTRRFDKPVWGLDDTTIGGETVAGNDRDRRSGAVLQSAAFPPRHRSQRSESAFGSPDVRPPRDLAARHGRSAAAAS